LKALFKKRCRWQSGNRSSGSFEGVSARLLFRAEAVQAQTAQHLGSIRIGRNPRFTAVVCVALVLGAALIAFALWGQVTRKARIAGLLAPMRGSLQMTAQAAGIVTDIAAAEGAFVGAGQALFTLNTDRAGTAGDTAALIAQNLQQRRVTLDAERALRELQARQRQQALADRIRSLQVEQGQADNEAQLAERRVALAEKSV
jgi:membrane fusion protein